jgi:hypothetical protein
VKRGQSSNHDDIFEYVVWIPAKDKPDPKNWLNNVLDAIAEATNNSAIKQLSFEQPEQNREKKERVKKLLSCYKILILIDNFEIIDDLELVEWLERIPDPSKAIIVSRRPKRIAAWTMRLRGLEAVTATMMLEELVPWLEVQIRHDLVRVTEGNPQAMLLALGLVQGGEVDLKEIISQLENPDKNPNKILNQLLSGSWRLLPEPARQILLAMPLFVGSIGREALRAAAGLSVPDFEQGLARCLRFRLLEEDHDDPQRYVVHPMTRAFARNEWNPRWEREAKRRCTEHFRELVRKRVVREQPEPPYWNALVSKRMAELVPEWPSIQQVMAWAAEDGQDEVLVDFVMLLVHYMDSRCLNVERLDYVQKAVAALQRMGRQEEEALLRIDALGWTHVEVLELEEAHNQIDWGLRIARGEDLKALGLAWKARVSVEEKNFKSADEFIREARAIACSSWIRFRVNMAAGDIELKRKNAKAALNLYQLAAKQTDLYGGEGYEEHGEDGYQICPRMGLAHLELGEIDEAERKFKKLSGLKQIPIGKLYAEYGLALVAHQRGNLPEARVMLDDVKREISRQTRPNLLLRLIEEQEARMQGSQEAEGLEPSLTVHA